MTHRDAISSTASRSLRGFLLLALGWLVGVVARTHAGSSTAPSGSAEDALSDIPHSWGPDGHRLFDLLDGFVDDDGDTVLLVREAAPDDDTAVCIEEMFDAFGGAYVFVLPEAANIERSTRARVAERAGVDLGALSTARQAYSMMMANPGEGHLHTLGEALDRVWS